MLDIYNSNLQLLQIPGTSNLKHPLIHLSPFLSKKDHLATSIIEISPLRSLLPKPVISGAFQH